MSQMPCRDQPALTHSCCESRDRLRAQKALLETYITYTPCSSCGLADPHRRAMDCEQCRKALAALDAATASPEQAADRTQLSLAKWWLRSLVRQIEARRRDAALRADTTPEKLPSNSDLCSCGHPFGGHDQGSVHWHCEWCHCGSFTLATASQPTREDHA